MKLPAQCEKAVDLAQKDTAMVSGRPWRIADWTTFIVLAWMVVNLSVVSRKGESTKLPGDVDGNDWFTSLPYALFTSRAGRTTETLDSLPLPVVFSAESIMAGVSCWHAAEGAWSMP